MENFKHKKLISAIIIFLCLNLFVNFIDTSKYISPVLTYASVSDLNYAIENKIFGNLNTISLSSNSVLADSKMFRVDVKFLNLFTVKSFLINTSNATIYAGGDAVGVKLNTYGVILMGYNSIITNNGLVDTLKGTNLQVGDIILKINNETIFNIDDITNIINKEENKGKKVKITYLRKNKEYEEFILPALDEQTGEYKLGVWVKNDTTGIGTLTYVNKDGFFGALGHSIFIGTNKENLEINGGKLYNCSILGINKAQKGKAGELKGFFLQGGNEQGEIYKNSNTGIYGKLFQSSNLLERAKLREYKIGGRFTARPGKAKILCQINSNEVKEYDIEIIKTNYQNSSKEKSMVIKVVDKELLNKTGGIVQGMSGSPIIQNDKIIGAVTHVFLNDSTKGYGLYLDWMK